MHDDAGTWLTKAELARVRRISIASADRLIRRQGWRRQPGNDGRVRVLIPSDWMQPRHDDPTDRPTDGAAADPTDQPAADPTDTTLMARGLAALEDAVQVLREQLQRAEQRADRAVADITGERTRADLATARAADATAEVSSLRDRLEAAQQATTEAVQAANALRRADEARRGKGLLGRVLAAWRGG